MNDGCRWDRGDCRRLSAKLDRWLIVAPRLGERGAASTGGVVSAMPDYLLDRCQERRMELRIRCYNRRAFL